jgi:chromosome segregation protein
MHSVVSQGRVEGIVTSKPRDRRMLIEEAAGLGKHRKRRRRAQLKLERTQDNLDRSLDVEREARSRLRPLKRQAEAAELHQRLERQTLEARWTLARDAVRVAQVELAAASEAAGSARAARGEAEEALRGVAARRDEAEQALARRTEQREALARRTYAARSGAERVDGRLERVRALGEEVAERAEGRRATLRALEAAAAQDVPDEAGRGRIEALEAELEQLEAHREAALDRELASLGTEREEADADVSRAAALVAQARDALREADAAAEAARLARRETERVAEAARREAARVGAELAACNQYLRTHAGAAGRGAAGLRSLADELEVEAGCERALAAALGGRLRAALADDRGEAERLLARLGDEGGRVLVAGADDEAATSAAHEPPSSAPPTPGAQRLAGLVRGPAQAVALARRLLGDAWLVDDLAALPPDFRGTAVTTSGRVWLGGPRELRQAPRDGDERVLAERNRRDALVAESERAVQAEQSALADAEARVRAVGEADRVRDDADRELRGADRVQTAASEEARRAGWLIEQRRLAPDEGATAVRRAQVEGELAAERRVAQRAERDREERAQRIASVRTALQSDEALVPRAQRLATALEGAAAAIADRVEALDAELAADRAAGEDVAARLRACATEEARVQAQLREHGEAVTRAEVRAQQARDRAQEAMQELTGLAERLGLEPEPATEKLPGEEAQALQTRIERLQRRREQLGPVNPLAKAEYDEALAHVEELERQRTDLETALRELKSLIRETDRQIRETFEETFHAAARNFEELAATLFPGGRGRLSLVQDDTGPRPVLGGEEPAPAEAADEPVDEAQAAQEEDLAGVEIEITPAGKAMKRLTLLSGGEKSMTAIAFLFAVFLARPCPFYILDEVEAALDDLNIGRFLDLLRRYADRAQFIVVTHQRRTMEAADTLYGVSMGDDGVSKVVSRRLPREVAA